VLRACCTASPWSSAARASRSLFFLVLPLMQAITSTPEGGLDRAFGGAPLEVPPPPPPIEEEPEEEQPEPEEKPPELTKPSRSRSTRPARARAQSRHGDGLDGSRATSRSSSSVGPGGGAERATAVDALFSLADLDQKPRVIYQPAPRSSTPR
jgi:protein TonB